MENLSTSSLDPWRTEQIFLTVKAYPTISKKYREACCMAGITRSGEWIRLYPVHFRDLDNDQKFKKHTWIEARVKRSNDFREESYEVDHTSIRILEEVPTTNNWAQRNAIVLPLLRSASVAFDNARNSSRNTLALIRPAQILGLEIEKTEDSDFRKQVENLNALQGQLGLFSSEPMKPFDLVPYSFRYRYLDEAGKVHTQKIVDWEIYALYRKCRGQANWEELIRQKYEIELPRANIHFYLGTMHMHPRSWIIIGVYWPKSTVSQPNMFDG